jgi:hexosaminidase
MMKCGFLALLFLLPIFGHSTDFPVKAFHIDLRIQVMTMPALKTFVERLQQGGINTVIMEYEGTYPYEKHPLISNRYAYTKAEIVSFVAFCRRLGVDVIPLQQSFGHVEYILRHQRYKTLRESEKDLSQVCPLQVKEDSLLFTELYTELASTHTSPYIHIGCDETHLLGYCDKCRRKAAEEGISKLYIDYVRMLCNIVIRLGKRPILWADIALKYPEAIRSLPKQTIFVDWNYGWDLNNFGDHQKMVESGYEIWGAPALRSNPDNYYLTQWEKHLHNISHFTEAARNMGYKGIVLTSWSTSGAYSYLYESEDNLSDLQAIRHVYPITGFNILVAAYVQSIGSTPPFDADGFIADYCGRQYGFTPSQAATFWKALKTAPYEVADGIVDGPITLSALADSVTTAAETLHALHPLKNEREFEHYRLMADIRRQHVQFLVLEAEANATCFTRAAVPGLLTRVAALRMQDTALSKRFIDLNGGSFHPSELEQENRLRAYRLKAFYERLSQLR